MNDKVIKRKKRLIIMVTVVTLILTPMLLMLLLITLKGSRCILEVYSSAPTAVQVFDELMEEDNEIQTAYVEYSRARTDGLAYLIREKGGMTPEELQEQVELLHLQNAWIADEPREGYNDEDAVHMQSAPIDGEHYLITETSAYNSQEFAETSSVILDELSQVVVGEDAHFLLVNDKDQTVSAYSEEPFVNGSYWFLNTLKITMDESGEPVDMEVIGLGNGISSVSFVVGMDITDQLTAMENGYRVYLVEKYDDVLIHLAVSIFNLFLIFGACIFLSVRYTLLALREKEKEYTLFRTVLLRLITASCILMLLLTFFLQTLLDTTNLMNKESLRGNRAAATMESLQEKKRILEDWYGQSNLVKCRLAAEIVQNSPTELTREDMKNISETLGVRYTYRFDKHGTVMVTDSPYDHFSLSHDPTSQSYAFLPLLEGKESYVQDFMEDDVSGESQQYAGVSLRDQKDLADGFVQICVSADALTELERSYSVEGEIDRIGTASDSIAFIVDAETNTILYSTEKSLAGKNLDNTEISQLTLKDGMNGFIRYNLTTYLVNVTAVEGGFLVLASPGGEAVEDRWFTTLYLTATVFLSLGLVSLIALFRYRRYQKEEQDRLAAEASAEPAQEEDAPGETSEEAAELEKEEDANEWGLFSLSSFLNKNVKDQDQFEARWNEKKKDPESLTAETKIFDTIKHLLLMLSAYVVTMLIINALAGTGSNHDADRWSLLNYLFYGNWEKGLNIFSITMCCLIICVSITCIAVLNRILYHIVRLASARGETICILLRSSTKYIAFLIIVYFCTAQFVENATVLFATVGASSIVIGIGAQSLIGDILAGLFLVFDDVFRVGDMLNVDGWIGVVTAVGIRTTTVTSFSDAKVYNNSDLRKIINMNKGVARAMAKVSLAYQEDLEKVEAQLEEELPGWKSKIPGATRPPYYSGVDRLGYNAVVIRVACYVDNYSRWAAARALNRELKLLFDKHGIHTTYMEEASYLDFFGTSAK
ncbi:MAG: mechanosensitive ion channel [Lachnospiraceae bacterium]|nr:mechanosensitive ion channel [Lachnospiraceae bacterium]